MNYPVAVVDEMREVGKKLLFSPISSIEEKQHGLEMLLQAVTKDDPEAQYLIGKFCLEGRIRSQEGDSIKKGTLLLCKSANSNYMPARVALDSYCNIRYNQNHWEEKEYDGPLVDFEGKRIVIDCSGKMVPVDAKLEYKNGQNILTFSLNLSILDDESCIADQEKLFDTIIQGIKMWEGEYKVFGNQDLSVKINVTRKKRLYLCLYYVALIIASFLVGTGISVIQNPRDYFPEKSLYAYDKEGHRRIEVVYKYDQVEVILFMDSREEVIGGLYEANEWGTKSFVIGSYDPESDTRQKTEFNTVSLHPNVYTELIGSEPVQTIQYDENGLVHSFTKASGTDEGKTSTAIYYNENGTSGTFLEVHQTPLREEVRTYEFQLGTNPVSSSITEYDEDGVGYTHTSRDESGNVTAIQSLTASSTWSKW